MHDRSDELALDDRISGADGGRIDAHALAEQHRHGSAVRTAQRRRQPVEIPPHGEAIAPVAAVQLVVHLTVEVAREPVRERPELVEVEVRVAREQGIERPPDDRDSRGERLRALRHLQRVADALRSSPGTHGQHVGVEVQAPAHAGEAPA